MRRFCHSYLLRIRFDTSGRWRINSPKKQVFSRYRPRASTDAVSLGKPASAVTPFWRSLAPSSCRIWNLIYDYKYVRNQGLSRRKLPLKSPLRPAGAGHISSSSPPLTSSAALLACAVLVSEQICWNLEDCELGQNMFEIQNFVFISSLHIFSVICREGFPSVDPWSTAADDDSARSAQTVPVINEARITRCRHLGIFLPNCMLYQIDTSFVGNGLLF